MTALADFDRALFLALNNGLKCRAFDAVMPLVTDLGLGHVQAFAVVIAACFGGAASGEFAGRGWFGAAKAAVRLRSRWVGPMLLSIALVGVISPSIKALSGDRPTEFYRLEHAAGRRLDERAMTVEGVKNIRVARFPSGHTATSVSLAMTATLLFWGERRRLLLGALWILAGLIGFSRVYLADHWPLDVAGGLALGAAVAWFAIRVCERWARSSAPVPEPAHADA